VSPRPKAFSNASSARAIRALTLGS
jgi:hypothetical protein